MAQKRGLGLSLAAVALLAVAIGVAAQESGAPSAGLCPRYGEPTVSVALQPLPSKVLAGASVPVTVRISNLREYPLTDGMIVARIVAKKADDKAFAGLSGSVLTRIVPVKDLFIASRSFKEASFTLPVPARLPSGEYAVEAIYTLSELDPQNIDSEPHVGKPNAATTDLAVDNPVSGAFVYVDPSSARAEGDDESATVSVELVNPGKEEEKVPLLWMVHYGNAITDETAILSAVDSVDVPASGKVRVSYPIRDDNHASYVAVAQTVSDGVRSFGTVRADGSHGETLVNYLGMVSAGSGAEAFACVSNAFTDDASGRKVSLLVTDGNGAPLGEATFPVATSTNDMEFALPFASSATGDVIVAADVSSRDGDRAHFEKVFDCTDLGGCSAAASVPDVDWGLVFAATLFAAGVGGIFSMVMHHRERRRKRIIRTRA